MAPAADTWPAHIHSQALAAVPSAVLKPVPPLPEPQEASAPLCCVPSFILLWASPHPTVRRGGCEPYQSEPQEQLHPELPFSFSEPTLGSFPIQLPTRGIKSGPQKHSWDGSSRSEGGGGGVGGGGSGGYRGSRGNRVEGGGTTANCRMDIAHGLHGAHEPGSVGAWLSRPTSCPGSPMHPSQPTWSAGQVDFAGHRRVGGVGGTWSPGKGVLVGGRGPGGVGSAWAPVQGYLRGLRVGGGVGSTRLPGQEDFGEHRGVGGVGGAWSPGQGVFDGPGPGPATRVGDQTPWWGSDDSSSPTGPGVPVGVGAVAAVVGRARSGGPQAAQTGAGGAGGVGAGAGGAGAGGAGATQGAAQEGEDLEGCMGHVTDGAGWVMRSPVSPSAQRLGTGAGDGPPGSTMFARAGRGYFGHGRGGRAQGSWRHRTNDR